MNTQTTTAFTQALESAHLDALNELKAQMTDPAASRSERRLAAAAILRIRPPSPPPVPKVSSEVLREHAAMRREMAELIAATERLAAGPLVSTTPPAPANRHAPATANPALPGRSAAPSPSHTPASIAAAHQPSRPPSTTRSGSYLND